MADRIGGSFAPPVTLDAMKAYAALARTAPPQVAGAMNALLLLADEHMRHPRSAAAGAPHPSGRGVMVPLSLAVKKALDPHLPWDEELAATAALFGAIDPASQGPLRDAAHHLLWYARELALGREPITSDTL